MYESSGLVVRARVLSLSLKVERRRTGFFILIVAPIALSVFSSLSHSIMVGPRRLCLLDVSTSVSGIDFPDGTTFRPLREPLGLSLSLILIMPVGIVLSQWITLVLLTYQLAHNKQHTVTPRAPHHNTLRIILLFILMCHVRLAYVKNTRMGETLTPPRHWAASSSLG
jgi:hypothetical protein